MEQLKRLAADAGEAFGRLSSREKLMILGAAAAVLIFVVFFITVTFSNALKQGESRIAGKMRQLQEAQRYASGYSQAERERTNLERQLRNNNVRLFTLIEESAKKQGVEVSGVTDRGTKPGEGKKIVESSVEGTLTRIELLKLVRFLTSLEERNKLVKVTKLQIRARADQPVLDAWLTVTTYQLET